MSREKTKPTEKVFHLTAELENQTLAAALRHWLPDRSWSQVKHLTQSRYILVSGNSCVDPGRRLKAGDVVKLLSQPAPAAPREHDIRVQYLDEHLVVVEKPAGMTSNRHREERMWSKRRKQIQGTLDELLPRTIQNIEGRQRRGIPVPVRAVHRLDRETSGLMVFARTHAAERILAQQFRKHTTHRRYLAIVQGQLPAQTISSRLVRDRGDGRRGSTDLPNTGKLAVTHVTPLETSGKYTLIECRLETGRTHQIRIHLSEHGHPVCGDKVYRSRRSAVPVEDSSGARRLALHAAELGFVHPVTGKALQFRAALPADLLELWRRLKCAAGAKPLAPGKHVNREKGN